MKKVKVTIKETNKTHDCLFGNVGEKVFAACNNVKETNDAIRWCNTHKVGDKFDCNDYSMEIVED